MNLRKPFLTTIFIILLSLDLIFLSFLFASNKVLNKEYLSSKIRDFDITGYIKDREYVTNNSENFKYPKEIFDYISKKQFYSIADDTIDKLLDGESPIIESTDITKLLTYSVKKYDSLNHSDSSSYVKDDIMRFSTELSYKLNNDGLVYLVKIMLFLSKGIILIIPIIIALLFSFLIWLNEKRNGFLINGIVFVVYSFYLYYFNTNFLKLLMNSSSFYSYFENYKSYTLLLDSFYTICFILGFVLLLIYIVLYLKKVVRDVRLNSYESWR